MQLFTGLGNAVAGGRSIGQENRADDVVDHVARKHFEGCNSPVASETARRMGNSPSSKVNECCGDLSLAEPGWRRAAIAARLMAVFFSALRLWLLVSRWFRIRRELQDQNVFYSRAFGEAESGDQQVAEWIEKRIGDAIDALEIRHRLIDSG